MISLIFIAVIILVIVNYVRNKQPSSTASSSSTHSMSHGAAPSDLIAIINNLRDNPYKMVPFYEFEKDKNNVAIVTLPLGGPMKVGSSPAMLTGWLRGVVEVMISVKEAGYIGRVGLSEDRGHIILGFADKREAMLFKLTHGGNQ